MSQTTIDADDIDRFDRQADQWWNPDGPMKPLHLFTPVRLDYILCGARRAGLSGPAGHVYCPAGRASGSGCRLRRRPFGRTLMSAGGRNDSN